MFNIIGVTWMVILLPVFLPFVIDFMQDYAGTTDAPITLAAFHTFFNLTNVIIMLAFVPLLVRAAIWSVKGSAEDADEFNLKFIGNSSKTPELALPELQKEAGHFGEVVSRMSDFTRTLINSVEPKKQKKAMKKLKKYEKISDRMEVEITEYITDLSNGELTAKTSQRLRSVINICNDLERAGDVYFQISKTFELKIEERAYFTPQQRENLNAFCDKIDLAFEEMVRNLNAQDYDKVNIETAVQLEKDINAFRNQLREQHLNNLGTKDYNVKSAMMYNNIFHALEKIGDHIINVTESVAGEI